MVLVALLGLGLTTTATARAVIPTAATGAEVSAEVDGLCAGCSVTDAHNVIASDLGAPATVAVPVGVAGSARLDVAFGEAIGRGAKVGFRIGASGPLDLSLLGYLTLTTYSEGQPQVSSADGAPVRVLPSDDGTALVLMNARKDFDEVRLEVGSLVALSVDIRVYHAIAIPKVRAIIVREVPTEADGAWSDGDASGGICVPLLAPCEVIEPGNVTANDIEAFTRVSMPLGVGASAWVDVHLPEDQTLKPKAGFVIREGAGLLDAQLLDIITLTTYRDGAVQRSASGADLLDLKVLGDGEVWVYMRSQRPFDQLRITFSSLLSVGVQVDVIHARLQYRVESGAATEAPATHESLMASAPHSAPEAAPFALSAPAPNPAAGRSQISLMADRAQHVRVRVFDAAGREVAALFEGRIDPGSTEVGIDGAALPSGAYVVLAEGEGVRATQRLTIVR